MYNKNITNAVEMCMGLFGKETLQKNISIRWGRLYPFTNSLIKVILLLRIL